MLQCSGSLCFVLKFNQSELEKGVGTESIIDIRLKLQL